MEANQCDGCKRGLAVKDKIHFEKDGKPYIGCSSSLYEKSHRPSDLEIVQKALVKAHKNIWCNLIFYREGWEVRAEDLTVAYGDTVESLLTWAKQTVGEG